MLDKDGVKKAQKSAPCQRAVQNGKEKCQPILILHRFSVINFSWVVPKS